MRGRKGTRGVITVLVSLMLVGVLSIGTLVIESGRYQAAKTQLAEANISASTSMIAAYDADLYERYGLLAIDTERFTPQRATDYLNFNGKWTNWEFIFDDVQTFVNDNVKIERLEDETPFFKKHPSQK